MSLSLVRYTFGKRQTITLILQLSVYVNYVNIYTKGHMSPTPSFSYQCMLIMWNYTQKVTCPPPHLAVISVFYLCEFIHTISHFPHPILQLSVYFSYVNIYTKGHMSPTSSCSYQCILVIWTITPMSPPPLPPHCVIQEYKYTSLLQVGKIAWSSINEIWDQYILYCLLLYLV